MHVKGQGANLPYAKADDALNGALKKAGIQLHTVSPETTKTPNEQTITATGVHVAFAQPVDAPGVPAQFVEHILGEVFVDSLAAPAGPAPSLDLGGGGSAGSLGGGSTLGGGTGSTGFASGGGSSYGLFVPAGVAPGERHHRASRPRFVAARAADEQAGLAPRRLPRVADARDRHRDQPAAIGGWWSVVSVAIRPPIRRRPEQLRRLPPGRVLVPPALHRGQVPALRRACPRRRAVAALAAAGRPVLARAGGARALLAGDDRARAVHVLQGLTEEIDRNLIFL